MTSRGMKNADEKESLLPTHVPSEKADRDGGTKVGKYFLSAEAASSPLISGIAYCTVSASMVLLNKFALSGFDFTCPNSLLLLQCAASIFFVKIAELWGVWKVEQLRWDLIKVRTTIAHC
jgi:hypothetical protein